MEVLIHGIFTIIKLAILGSIYASLALLSFRIIGLLKPESWADQVSKKKIKFWFISGALISVGLVVFANTHWGSHGLGDFATIPLSHGKTINQINGTQAFIDIEYKYGQLFIGDFAKTSDYVVGKTETSPVDDPKDFFVWSLQTNEVNYFTTKDEFEIYADKNDLPKSIDFKSFWEHYQKFWGGWRYWSLL